MNRLLSFKQLLFFIFLALPPSFVYSQPKAFSPVGNTAAIQEALSKNALKTHSISSKFTQEKHMKMLQDKVTSNGKFYFKNQDKIRIEYLQPFQYLLVMNAGNITIKENGKVNKVNTRNSRMMQSVNQVMIDCMRGTVFANKDFVTSPYASATQYLLVLKPKDDAMKKIFSEIHIYLQKRNMAVSQLIMKESNGDHTTMDFSDIKINPTLADALFFIR